MALMPAPMIVAENDSWTMLISGLLATDSANPEMAMAMTREAIVRPRSYVRGIGSEKASMPMKCIDQMPQPIASAPPTTHMPVLVEFLARATRADRLSAVYDTKIATRIESRTSQELYVPTMIGPPCRRADLGRSASTIPCVGTAQEEWERGFATQDQ